MYPLDNLHNYPTWLINKHKLTSKSDWEQFTNECQGGSYLFTEKEVYVRCSLSVFSIHPHVFESENLEQFSDLKPYESYKILSQ